MPPVLLKDGSNMDFSTMQIDNFNALLASRAAVPGGGGASALAASLGCALGSMVVNLTVGKKKYAQYENELGMLMAELEQLREKCQSLIDEDAKAFEPLSKAYSIPKDASGRGEEMERCLRLAAEPPMEIVRLSCKGIKIHRRLEEIGSVMAVSDVGTGVIMLWAALYGAAMNVRVNTKLMSDREYAEKLNCEVDSLMSEHWKIAENVYEKVWESLK